VARVPGNGFFVLPGTGAYVIEVTSSEANAVGGYTVSLGDPSTPYGVTGTVSTGVVGLAGVTVTFSIVAGGGSIPAPATTGAGGGWVQAGCSTGTVYRATPSLAGYVFSPPSLDFDAPASLNFTATAVGCSAFTPTPIAIGQTLSGT